MSTTETKLTVDEIIKRWSSKKYEGCMLPALGAFTCDEVAEILRASLEAKGAWEPIERAPKDGTLVLVTYAPHSTGGAVE